jgi:hypothetical protein
VELYEHLGERGVVLEPSLETAEDEVNGEGGEGRLALEVWMMGVFVLLDTPELLPMWLRPRGASMGGKEAETPVPPVEEEEGEEDGDGPAGTAPEKDEDVAL